eukprot:5997338-Pyramimonas_sp.AAC.1
MAPPSPARAPPPMNCTCPSWAPPLEHSRRQTPKTDCARRRSQRFTPPWTPDPQCRKLVRRGRRRRRGGGGGGGGGGGR